MDHKFPPRILEKTSMKYQPKLDVIKYLLEPPIFNLGNYLIVGIVRIIVWFFVDIFVKLFNNNTKIFEKNKSSIPLIILMILIILIIVRHMLEIYQQCKNIHNKNLVKARIERIITNSYIDKKNNAIALLLLFRSIFFNEGRNISKIYMDMN